LLFLQALKKDGIFDRVVNVRVLLYGSLAKTGKGHGTDIAVQLGLNGENPETFDVDAITGRIKDIASTKHLRLGGERVIDFDPKKDIVFLITEMVPLHPNALTFSATLEDNPLYDQTYHSVGGGFVVKE